METIFDEEQAWCLAWEMVLSNEGKQFINHPSDKGGATKFGVSLKQWRKQRLEMADLDGDNDVDADDIKALTEETAEAWFKKNYWEKFNLNHLLDAIVAAQFFDAIVNIGPRAGVRCIQRALRAVGKTSVIVKRREKQVVIDGIFGPITEAALNSLNNEHTPGALLSAFDSEHAAYYRMIVQRDPTQSIFLKGWLNRAYGDQLGLEP